jgi:hypothetical protein
MYRAVTLPPRANKKIVSHPQNLRETVALAERVADAAENACAEQLAECPSEGGGPVGSGGT